MRHADLREPDRQPPIALPALPPRLAAEPPRQRPASAPPRPTPPPGSYVDDIPYSLNQRINAELHTPIARLPDAAPTDLAVEPNVATNVLHVEVHTRPVPHTQRGRLRIDLRELNQEAAGHPARGSPSAPSAPRY